MNSQTRRNALAKFLKFTPDEVEEIDDEGPEFQIGSQEYAVLTDEEATDRARDYIRESVWAFNADFIVANSDLPPEAEEMVRTFQEEKCEGANDTILAMINDFDMFAERAVSADGRGHFLNTYDGEEHEIQTPEGTAYIYRLN